MIGAASGSSEGGRRLSTLCSTWGPSNIPSTRRWATASRTSGCSRSWLLVSTHRSVSSTCRCTQTVSDEASVSTQAMTMSVYTSTLRRRGVKTAPASEVPSLRRSLSAEPAIPPASRSLVRGDVAAGR